MGLSVYKSLKLIVGVVCSLLKNMIVLTKSLVFVISLVLVNCMEAKQL